MLEHFSSLRRKNSENTQVTSSGEKLTSLLAEDGQKDVSDLESMSSKTKNLFKDLISDNGATNTILHCTNFIKCTGTSTMSHLNVYSSSSSSCASNGTCKQQKVDNHDGVSDNNEKQEAISNLSETNSTNVIAQGREGASYKKRNSIAPTGEMNLFRELSPSPRSLRKSSYDSRMLRSSADEDTGKHSNIMRPLKTRNIITKNDTFDTLHYRAMDVSITFIPVFHFN
jgi:hypothetical protein